MRRSVPIVTLLVLISGGILMAQRYRNRRGGEGWLPEDAQVRTAREVPTHSVEFPRWTNALGFEKDVFTFARIRYKRQYYGWRAGGYCFTDFPDSDLDLSYRLQQLTSLSVDPDGRVLKLTDLDLFHYPWIYMVEPGGLRLEEDEVVALRKYLLSMAVS